MQSLRGGHDLPGLGIAAGDLPDLAAVIAPRPSQPATNEPLSVVAERWAGCAGEAVGHDAEAAGDVLELGDGDACAEGMAARQDAVAELATRWP